jgi:hypothetical protein
MYGSQNQRQKRVVGSFGSPDAVKAQLLDAASHRRDLAQITVQSEVSIFISVASEGAKILSGGAEITPQIDRFYGKIRKIKQTKIL